LKRKARGKNQKGGVKREKIWNEQSVASEGKKGPVNEKTPRLEQGREKKGGVKRMGRK